LLRGVQLRVARSRVWRSRQVRLKSSALAVFACPTCEQVLRAAEAQWLCSCCGTSYPVEDGVPRFVPPQNYALSFGYQWNVHGKTQLDSHTGLPISRHRFFEATQWPENLEGQLILEAASGAGRFTEVLAGTGATVYSFDLSRAVEANRANNGHYPNLTLFQADLCRLPLVKQAFDKVVCLGALQHTPDPERAFRSLAQQVRPGGQLVIDIYRRSLPALLQWKYLLRPITRRIAPESLYRWVRRAVPPLVPIAAGLRRLAGRAGARLVPIVEYSHLGLRPELNVEWAVLDTFDMYSPAHDHPKSLEEVNRWCVEAGLAEIEVGPGQNGVVARARRPTGIVTPSSGCADVRHSR